MFRLFIISAMSLLVTSVALADVHVCAPLVKDNATKLFALHYGIPEVEAAKKIVNTVDVMPPLKSPNGKTNYAVLQTFALIGKGGDYRIRMIFAVLGPSTRDCLLMGQEILDMSSL